MDMAAQATSTTFSWQETGRVAEADEWATLETVVREHARFVFKVAYGVLRICMMPRMWCRRSIFASTARV
jgi:hypothetical protein